jgi:HrpA-like RNA helicase
MPPPTLLLPGFLVSPKNVEFKDRPAVDYITSWVTSRRLGNARPQHWRDRVLLVRSDTGSGKSTALPVYLFRTLRPPSQPFTDIFRGKDVVCTQPRVLTAIEIAKDLSAMVEYPDIVLGETLGYQTGTRNQKCRGNGLIFMTLDTLMAKMRFAENDQDIIKKYRIIIVDEVHERNIWTDLVLSLLKQFIARNYENKDVPFVLLCSATLDTEKMEGFFDLGSETNTVIVKGRTYPIKRHYTKTPVIDYPRAAAEKAHAIHLANLTDDKDKCDILIFAPGAAEMKKITDYLDEFNQSQRSMKSKTPPYKVTQVSGPDVTHETMNYRMTMLPPSELKVPCFDEPNKFMPVRRKIVLATNVAETGITINTLKYVIDSGWSRERIRFFPQQLSGVLTVPLSMSRAMQRMGRAGRKFPGEFHALYPESVFDAFCTRQYPAVITQGLDSGLLDLIIQQTATKMLAKKNPEFRVEDIDLPDAPPSDVLAATFERMLVLGFVSDNMVLQETPPIKGYGMTEFGRLLMTSVKMEPEAFRTIVASYTWDVHTMDMITIASMFDVMRFNKLYKMPKKGSGRPPPMLESKYLQTLREALPKYLNPMVGGADVPSDSEKFYFASMFLIADDYIETLFVFEMFLKQLRGCGGDVAKLKQWCSAKYLDFKTFMEIYTFRNGLVEEWIAMGLNPYWGYDFRLTHTEPSEFMKRIKAVKHCIFDGLKLNLLRYDQAANKYRTRHGIEVGVPNRLRDDIIRKTKGIGIPFVHKPDVIVSNKLDLQMVVGSDAKQLYTLRVDRVSVMSGFVDIDLDFLEPRKEDDDIKVPADYGKIDPALNPSLLLRTADAAARFTKPLQDLLSQVPRAGLSYLVDKKFLPSVLPGSI